MRIVFLGTPDIAVPSLCALKDAGHDILCVITKKDKARGRSGQPVPCPVKEKALELGIPVLHPKKLDDPELLEKLRSLQPDVFVVIAFGRILPPAFLAVPKLGCVNIHASLLPSYRGAAPIQWALIDGRKETGVTTMLMDEGLDTGDILIRYPVEIRPEETGGSLFDRLAVLAAEAITDTLPKLEAGKITPTPQGETDTAYAAQLTRETGALDWSLSSVQLERLIRALYPWPGTYSHLEGRLVKFFAGAVCGEMPAGADPAGVPGELLISPDRRHLYVRTGDGWLEILELQLEGKKRMTAQALLNGYHFPEHACLR